MNCGGKCGMFFLITINVIFLLLGLGLLITGVLLKVDSDVIDSDKVVATLNEVSLNDSIKFGNLAKALPIMMIVVGVFVLVIAAFGVFGACCKNRCLLVTYAIIVLIIFIVQVVVVVLFFVMKSKVENEVKSQLEDSLKKYDGTTSNEVSVGWDLLFVGFDCCGVDAVSSSNQQEFKDTAWYPSRGSDYVPYSCCVSATEDNYSTGSDSTCTQLTDYAKVNPKGCYQSLKDYIEKYQNAAIGIGVAVLVIELIGIVFAFVLCRAIGKDDMVV